MVGKLAMASLTGQSWRVLKSWYKGGGLEQRIWALFRRRYLLGLITLRLQRRLGFHCRGIIRGSCSKQLNWVRWDPNRRITVANKNTEAHLEAKKLFNIWEPMSEILSKNSDYTGTVDRQKKLFSNNIFLPFIPRGQLLGVSLFI